VKSATISPTDRWKINGPFCDSSERETKTDEIDNVGAAHAENIMHEYLAGGGVATSPPKKGLFRLIITQFLRLFTPVTSPVQ